MRNGITRKEFKTRLGYVLLGFFAVYMVDPVKNWIDTNLGINPIMVGILGFIAVLWFFEF